MLWVVERESMYLPSLQSLSYYLFGELLLLVVNAVPLLTSLWVDTVKSLFVKV